MMHVPKTEEDSRTAYTAMPKAKKWCLLHHGGNILALCCGALAEPSRQYKGVNDQTCDVPISGGILD